MRNQGILSTLFISLLSLFCEAWTADSLTILVEDFPYQVSANGEPFGASIEIVRELSQRAGLTHTMQIIPWARGYQQAQNGPWVMLVLGARTKERESLFKWVGPVDRDMICLYAKKNSKLQIKTLEDAKKVSLIGCLRQSIEEQLLRSHGFTNLDLTPDISSMVKKLMNGRIDLLPSGPLSIKAVVESSGHSVDDVVQVLVIEDTKYFLLMSKDIPDRVIETLNEKLVEMKKDGTFKAMFLRNKQPVPLL